MQQEDLADILVLESYLAKEEHFIFQLAQNSNMYNCFRFPNKNLSGNLKAKKVVAAKIVVAIK